MLTCGTFTLPSEIGGVKSQLIVGPAGTGKSTLLSAMACAYLADGGRIAWLDLDYSSFVLAHLLGADYFDVGNTGRGALCPLACLDDEGGLGWLDAWFERLFARWDLQLDERQAEDFQWSLREARRTGVRTLSGLRAIVPGEMQRVRRVLHHYIRYWGHIFDGDKRIDRTDGNERFDTANGCVNSVSRADSQANRLLTVYELRGLMGLGKRASAPATELILHNVISRLDGSPAWILVDEFWQLLGDEVSAEWLFDAIRTLRKKNCGLIGATQSLAEIVNSPYRDLLLESCPGKIFLPNTEAASPYGREQYRAIGVSDHEIACIARAIPKRQAYFKSAIGCRLFDLDLGDVAKAILASTGYNDVSRARELLGQGDFLSCWLQSRLPIATASALTPRG